MLPKTLRLKLFDSLSMKTMQYVTAVPSHKAEGLVKQVYDMIKEDFFVNGSLTSRSRVPQLLAAIWTVGRESMLVDDELDRTTKEAICAVMSEVNDCPYCGDMLISLVHAGKEHDAAKAPYRVTEKTVEPVLHLAEEDFIRVLAWASCVASRRYIAIIKERLDLETARPHRARRERHAAEVATAG